MAYNRAPNTVLAGRGLTQSPPSTTLAPAGIIPVIFDNDIATTTSLGVVQVGSGLSITSNGILSSTGSSSNGFVNVTLTSTNYTATLSDYYIGITGAPATVILPLGVIGKILVLKNQNQGGGVVRVKTSGDELIDVNEDRTLGSQSSITVLFDGTRWNLIS